MNRGTKRRRQGGFTLVELLVVIVILGILSAVVVFAVRGAGDKGRGAAVATDARTIRTAQEAYCAKAGRYASQMGQLTGDLPVAPDDPSKYKFLSEESEYHALRTQGANLQGNCPGQGPARYALDCKDGSTPPNCGAVGGSSQIPTPVPGTKGCDADPTEWRSGLWCTVSPQPSPSGTTQRSMPYDNVVQLLDGTVLTLTAAQGSDRATMTELYNPNDQNSTGRWTQWPVPEGLLFVYSTVLITDVGGGTCADNCGKVLMAGSTVVASQHVQTFWLYDPKSTAANKWTLVTDTSGPYNTYGTDMMLIKGPNCGYNCGKVLVATNPQNVGPDGSPPNSGSSSGSAPRMRLFDPETEQFEVLPLHQIGEDQNAATGVKLIASLPNGRILLQVQGGTWLFHPNRDSSDRGLFTGIDSSSYIQMSQYEGQVVNTSRGPEVVVLHAGQESGEVYNQRDGVWRGGFEGCAPPPPPPTQLDSGKTYCFLLAAVNGKVLARSVTVRDGFVQGPLDKFGGALHLFDPDTLTWSQIESPNEATTIGQDLQSSNLGRAAVLQGPQCGKHCGRVLVAGNRTSELYTPRP